MLLLEPISRLGQSYSPYIGLHILPFSVGDFAVCLRDADTDPLEYDGHGPVTRSLVPVTPRAAMPQNPQGPALHDHH